MEQINPYAVMRNTATYEAYRARVRAVLHAGQPFTTIALICFCVWSPLFSVAISRRMTPLMVAVAMLVVVGAACGIAAILRINRYRREHPIPDAWRQIPRLTPQSAPAQRPRRP